MRTLFCFLCLVSSAVAGDLAQFAYFDPTAFPKPLVVELRTANNELVRWEWNNVSLNSEGDGAVTARVNTAASVGVDWNAWSAAVINPSYNRILFSLGDVTVEKSWPLFNRPSSYTTLRVLEFYVDTWLPNVRPKLELIARDTAIAPEPASWLMLLLGLHVVSVRGWRSPSRTTPCRR